ncbi:MAG: hypothetical protein AAGA32_19545 [Pseudomonadota bacterium]
MDAPFGSRGLRLFRADVIHLIKTPFPFISGHSADVLIAPWAITGTMDEGALFGSVEPKP